MSLLERMGKAADQPGAPSPPERPRPGARPTPVVARPAKGGIRPELLAAKADIHGRLVELSSGGEDLSDRVKVREKIVEITEAQVRAGRLALTKLDLDLLVEALLDDVLGLGPLESLLNDPEITEILINHPRQIYVERHGRLQLSEVVFESDRQLSLVIDRVVSSVGRRVDESSPMCDARLADGSRVNVVVPPLVLKGACMSIRKFSREQVNKDDLLRSRSCTPSILRFMEAAVQARLNVLVSGGTSSGKTTLLNLLSGFIPATERIVTIEDAAELRLQQEHVITMESRPPNVEGTGEVPIRALLRNSLRMRPDRIVVGECRGGEALDMLQAMNTGHDGSMSTIHANTAGDAISRLETMVLMAGAELPVAAIRKQIAAAVDVIVQTARLRGGARRIVSVTEVTGLQGGEVTHRAIFEYRQLGVSPEGAAFGYHTATGDVPDHMDQLRAAGEDVPLAFFDPTPEPPREEAY